MAVTKTIKMNMTKEQWNAINQSLNGRRLDEFALTAMLKEAGAGPELINPELAPNAALQNGSPATPSIAEAASERPIEPRPATLYTPRDHQPPNSHEGKKEVRPAPPKDRRPVRVQGGRRGGSRLVVIHLVQNVLRLLNPFT